MIARRLMAAGGGLTLGLLLAVLSIEVLHIDRFALTAGGVVAGYAGTTALGCAIATAASQVSAMTTGRRAVLGASLSATLTFAVRVCPMPWVNLYSIGAGGGPAGELPMIVLPFCGALLGLGFFGDPPALRRVPP